MSIETVYREGRLIRSKWQDRDEYGRQLLCLLTALADNPKTRPETCPTSLAPQWLAHLLPWFDDAPSRTAWPSIIERCIVLAPHWSNMPEHISHHLDYYCRRVAVVQATKYTDHQSVKDVLTLIDRVLTGDEPKSDERWTVSGKAYDFFINAPQPRSDELPTYIGGLVASRAISLIDPGAAHMAAANVFSISPRVTVSTSMIEAMLSEMERVLLNGGEIEIKAIS